MLFKIALRNIFRNIRRTLITVLALGVGIGALILSDAFILGTIHSMKSGVINTLTGEVQLHQKDFLKSREVEFTFDPRESIERILKSPFTKSYTERIIANAMLTSSQGSQNVTLYGIDPIREHQIVKIKKMIVEGEYLTDKKTILIGLALAKALDVRVGEKISLTTSEVESGDLVQELFRVGGIFKYGTRELDKYVAFVSLGHANEILKLNGKIHEIALKSKGLSDQKLLKFAASLGADEIEAKSWEELNPAISSAIDMSSYSSMIVGAILLVIVAFGIMNTMFMSIYDRIYEFGILKAIGTRPLQIFKMILVESFYLGGLGAIMGVIIGAILSLWLRRIGIDYSDIEMGMIGFSEPLRPQIEIYQYLIFPALFWIFTVLVSIYPAVFAAKINPVKAIRD